MSSRPVSIQQLLQAKKQQEPSGKPQFLSKKKRAALRKEEQDKKTVMKPVPKPHLKRPVVQYEDEQDMAPITTTKPHKNDNKRPKKFNFEWDLHEDTSATTADQDNGHFFIVKRPQSDQIALSAASKAVHWSEKPLLQMTDRDWRICKEDYSITFKNGNLQNPLRSWQESEIPDLIVLHIVSGLGFAEPTPIQRATIPTLLKQRDIIGIAETGSGKTLLFIVPVLLHLLSRPKINSRNKDQGPYVLVLGPTRELVLQIAKEFQLFQKAIGFKCCSIIGGHSFEEIIYNLQDGAEVIVLTPGRLLDCIERRIVVFNQCRYLVMDEADRMINLGFEVQVNNILAKLPNRLERNTMMFTLTMPPEIAKLTDQYLNKPGIVTIGEVGVSAVESVRQEVVIVNDDRAKMSRLIQILNRGEYRPPIIIFVNYKKTGQDIYTKLSKEGFEAILMHGSKSQDQREELISKIKLGKLDILIATDVAGRGIDIADVSLVVNYQMSRKIEDYTHRIGRTGRAGKFGTAITFVIEQEDLEVLPELQRLVSRQKFNVPSNDAFYKKKYLTSDGNIVH